MISGSGETLPRLKSKAIHDDAGINDGDVVIILRKPLSRRMGDIRGCVGRWITRHASKKLPPPRQFRSPLEAANPAV